jgi:hypothetical protein
MKGRSMWKGERGRRSRDESNGKINQVENTRGDARANERDVGGSLSESPFGYENTDCWEEWIRFRRVRT